MSGDFGGREGKIKGLKNNYKFILFFKPFFFVSSTSKFQLINSPTQPKSASQFSVHPNPY